MSGPLGGGGGIFGLTLYILKVKTKNKLLLI